MPLHCPIAAWLVTSPASRQQRRQSAHLQQIDTNDSCAVKHDATMIRLTAVVTRWAPRRIIVRCWSRWRPMLQPAPATTCMALAVHDQLAISRTHPHAHTSTHKHSSYITPTTHLADIAHEQATAAGGVLADARVSWLTSLLTARRSVALRTTHSSTCRQSVHKGAAVALCILPDHTCVLASATTCMDVDTTSRQAPQVPTLQQLHLRWVTTASPGQASPVQKRKLRPKNCRCASRLSSAQPGQSVTQLRLQ